ncbi:hypothetical protein PENSPDRAFT_693194 [Peniophora sp. CONT]|nr:hypothetical protein PENSPDRAFT_693194 [Peniophora sp. CONT]
MPKHVSGLSTAKREPFVKLYKKRLLEYAEPIDYERVAYWHQRCKRFNHKLPKPTLQFRQDNLYDGCYYIRCDLTHTGDIQGSRKLFEWVSQPVDPMQLLRLRDERLAQETQHALDEEYRSSQLVSSRKGSVKAPHPYARPDSSKVVRAPPLTIPHLLRDTTTAQASSVQAMKVRVQPVAPATARARSPSIEFMGVGWSRPKARSPSIEVVPEPHPRVFIIWFFAHDSLPPAKVVLSVTAPVVMLRGYDSDLERVGIKIGDSIEILTSSKPDWTTVRVCDVSFRAHDGPLVVSAAHVKKHHDSLRGLLAHAYAGSLLK